MKYTGDTLTFSFDGHQVLASELQGMKLGG